MSNASTAPSNAQPRAYRCGCPARLTLGLFPRTLHGLPVA